MGRKIFTVLLVMVLLVLLPVFSYASASDFSSYTDIKSSFPDLSNIQMGGTRYLLAFGGYSDDYYNLVSVSSSYDYQFVFTGSAVSSASPFFSTNGLAPHNGPSVWNGEFALTDNGFTVTFNREDASFSGSKSICLVVPVSSYSNVKLTNVYRGTLKTEPEPHNITVTSSGYGSVSSSVSSAVEGTSINLTAIPSAGYSFSHWEVVSGGVSVSNNSFVMPDNDVVIIGHFTPISYNVSVSSGGNGSASASPTSATAGSTITLNASPAAGYVFSEWQVLSGDVSIVNNQFIMPNSDVSVKAIFVPDGYHSITVQNDGHGTGSANPVRAEAGERITLTAVPVMGYEFDKWQVVSGAVNISNNQFIMPDSDVVVKATFKPIIYTITLNQGSNGSATVSANSGIVGDVITLTAVPDGKYNFSHWNIIQGDISIDNNQFIMPASNVVIEPVFLEVTAISSGFKYNSGRIDGSYSSHYDVLDINFGDVPAGDYLLNIYHWGSSYNARFGLYYGDKYLAFSSADGLSTTAIEHKGGEFRLYGGLDLTRASTVSAEAHVVWISSYGGSGTLDLDNPSTWTFNIEDVVLIPVDTSHLEDYGSVSSLVAFFRDSFDDFKGFLSEQIGRIVGDEEAESDVKNAADELNKEVEDLNNLSGDLDDYSSTLENQFDTDFKIDDNLVNQASNVQLIYSGLFSSLGIWSIFIWLPVLLAVIKHLLRL